eukprot:g35695.t1
MGASKPVMNVETGEIFPSMRAAGSSVGRHWTSIRQAIDHPCKCAGFHWAFAPEPTAAADGSIEPVLEAIASPTEA